MKYIFLQTDLGGGLYRRTPIIFGNEMVHAQIASAMVTLLRDNGINAEVVSAGSCSVSVEVSKDDYSASLQGMMPLPMDETIINAFDYYHGIESKPSKPRYHKPKTQKRKVKK